MALGLPRFGCSAGAGGAFLGTGVKTVHSAAAGDLVAAGRRPPASGRKGSSGIACDPQHATEPLRRLCLAETEQEGGERDRIAAFITRRPVRPSAGLDVDLERP